MLLKHSGFYALARGLPGLINLLAIAVFSRLLNAEEYGHYALVVAAAGFGSGVLFQWLRLSILRFLPAHGDQPERLLSPVLSAYLIVVAFTAVVGGGVVFLVDDSFWQLLVVLGIVLVWAKGWFGLNQGIVRSRLSPRKYGFLSGTKSVVALGVGVGLVLFGLGEFGVLIGLIVAVIAAPLMFTLNEWKGVEPVWFDIGRDKYLLSYGVPLAVNSVLMWVITSSDRLLLGWLLNAEATGKYSVGYDLAQSSLGIVLMIVNLAAYPLAVEALESGGAAKAREQIRDNESLFLAVGIPATIGLALLAPEIANIVVGSDFQSAATTLIPWIALGALLSGIKLYHFDLAFQLGGRTIFLVWVSLGAGVTNLALNLLWIPRYGLMGSAYATVASYGVALLGSVLLGPSVFRVPWTWKPVGKAGLAASIMALVLYGYPASNGAVGLILKITIAAAIYTIAGIILNVAETRDPVRRGVRRCIGVIEDVLSTKNGHK